MKTFFTPALTYLLVMVSMMVEAQFTPNTPICPGTTVSYNITSSVFASKPLNWTVVGGVFTTNNSTTVNNTSSSQVIKWNNNITTGSFIVKLITDGTSQTFTVSATPITQPYSVDNIVIPCGTAGNVQTIVKIIRSGDDGTPAQSIIADGRNFVLPTGMQYVSNTYLGDVEEFNQFYQRYRVTFSVNGTVSGQATFKSFFSCSTDPNSTGILSSTVIPFSVIRSSGYENISLSGANQGCFGQSGSYTLQNAPSGISTTWSATGPLSLASSSSAEAVVNYGNTIGIGNVVVNISNACSLTAVKQLTVGVGIPYVDNVYYDGLPNRGPMPAAGGSTHYVGVSAFNSPSATYSLGVTNNSGNINVSLYGVNGGNAEIYVSGTVGNSAINYVATNVCGSSSGAQIVYIPYSYRAGPNPAKESVVVAFTDTKYQQALPDQIDIVSEKTMKAVRSINVSEIVKTGGFQEGNKIAFDIQDLPRGVYYLKVINPRQEKEKQIDMTRLYFE
ncbi:hypothetical protein [Fibrella arboris]|uniref:hypothetical protein n=1 Tax=Fibrella arboris TaxID=3242486 RepID=UPI003521B99C